MTLSFSNSNPFATPLLSFPLSIPSLSALVSDVFLISSAIPLSKHLHIPHYILFPSSASMLSLFAYYPFSKISDSISIPALAPIPRSSLPPTLLLPGSIFAKIFAEDGRRIGEVDGVLINSMAAMEGDTLAVLNSGMVVQGLPPAVNVGPLSPCEFENSELESESGSTITSWLDGLCTGSVVFASFGSQTVASREQIREIGFGLVRCGYKFLWVVKDNVVDKEDNAGLSEVVGGELMEMMKEHGMVVKDWVNQGEILLHRAVGGFVSHCGWNSLMEVVLNGVPVLAWPQSGDQMINAQIVANTGLGMWVKEWGWGCECVVEGGEIGGRIREMMENGGLREKALELKEEGMKVVEVEGRCDLAIQGLIRKWNK